MRRASRSRVSQRDPLLPSWPLLRPSVVGAVLGGRRYSGLAAGVKVLALVVAWACGLVNAAACVLQLGHSHFAGAALSGFLVLITYPLYKGMTS